MMRSGDHGNADGSAGVEGRVGMGIGTCLLGV